MAIKFEKIQAGMTLYQRKRQRMGNTTMTDLGEWRVHIISVSPENCSARVSWNGNRETTWHASQLTKLYDWSMYDEDVAEVTRGAFGSVQKVTKKKAPKPAKAATP